MNLDKTNLSKYKYIYRIYSNGSELHMEKFPIIYINNHYVYFRRPEDIRLKEIMLTTINKDYHTDTTFSCWYERYFISHSENVINEIFEVLKAQSEPYFTEQKKLRNESYLDRAKREYEKAKQKYELTMKIKENI